MRLDGLKYAAPIVALSALTPQESLANGQPTVPQCETINGTEVCVVQNAVQAALLSGRRDIKIRIDSSDPAIRAQIQLLLENAGLGDNISKDSKGCAVWAKGQGNVTLYYRGPIPCLSDSGLHEAEAGRNGNVAAAPLPLEPHVGRDEKGPAAGIVLETLGRLEKCTGERDAAKGQLVGTQQKLADAEKALASCKQEKSVAESAQKAEETKRIEVEKKLGDTEKARDGLQQALNACQDKTIFQLAKENWEALLSLLAAAGILGGAAGGGTVAYIKNRKRRNEQQEAKDVMTSKADAEQSSAERAVVVFNQLSTSGNPPSVSQVNVLRQLTAVDLRAIKSLLQSTGIKIPKNRTINEIEDVINRGNRQADWNALLR